MGIEHINRVGWIVIGAIMGCALALGLASSASDYERLNGPSLATWEAELIQKDVRSGRPLISGIVVHEPEYSNPNGADVRVVTYKRLGMTRNGRYGWLDRRVITTMPYIPERRGRVSAAEYPSVEQFLAEVATKNDFVGFRTGWWLIPKYAAILGAVIGMVVIGGIWPTLLGLMSGAGLGRRHNPKYKDDRPLWKFKSSTPAPAARPAVSAAAMARVDAIADAYQENLGGFAGGGSSAPGAAAATPEVRKLNAQQLEEAKQLPNPDADDDIEVKGEFYPVLFHHKKPQEEPPEEHHPKKDGE